MSLTHPEKHGSRKQVHLPDKAKALQDLILACLDCWKTLFAAADSLGVEFLAWNSWRGVSVSHAVRGGNALHILETPTVIDQHAA